MRVMFVGKLAEPTLTVTRENNGDVVIAGIDPNNMDRLNKMAIRMSAEEWEAFVEWFPQTAKFV